MAAAAEDKPSPMQLSTDELVEMSLDDIIKKTSKVNLKNRRKRPERKGPKERSGIPVKKAGENAKKSANKAKKIRDAAFSKGRGIEVTGGGDGGSGEGAKGRRRKGAQRGGGVQQQQGGGIKVQINKAAVGGKGGGQGNKPVTGTLNLPKDFKLPPGTTLKVSIQTGNKATATAVKTPPGNNSNKPPQQKKGQQQQQQQQGGIKKIKLLRKKGRVNPKTASTEAMQGAGKQARRIVLAQQGRNKRDRAFDAARGIQLTSGGGGTSTNKPKGGRGGGTGKNRGGRGMGQGRTRKVVVRGKQK